MGFRHEIVILDPNLPIRVFFSDDRKPTYVLPHFHSDLEIIYLLTGNLYVNRGTHSDHLYPGDIILLNSNEIHATQSFDDFTTAYVIQISMDYLKTVSLDHSDLNFDIPLRSSLHSKDAENAVTLQRLESLQKTISEFFVKTNPEEENYYFLYQHSILNLLLYLLCQYFINTGAPRSNVSHKDYERITKIDSYIKEHYIDNVTLHDMASYVGLTDTYFSRFFKNAFGIPFIKYLCSVRLDQARNALLTTNTPIQQICDSNGFANYQMFVQKFKEVYKSTPSEYRQKYK